jgi:hypothetical protein
MVVAMRWTGTGDHLIATSAATMPWFYGERSLGRGGAGTGDEAMKEKSAGDGGCRTIVERPRARDLARKCLTTCEFAWRSKSNLYLVLFIHEMIFVKVIVC